MAKPGREVAPMKTYKAVATRKKDAKGGWAVTMERMEFTFTIHQEDHPDSPEVVAADTLRDLYLTRYMDVTVTEVADAPARPDTDLHDAQPV